jgi:hypothetical protein
MQQKHRSASMKFRTAAFSALEDETWCPAENDCHEMQLSVGVRQYLIFDLKTTTKRLQVTKPLTTPRMNLGL